MKVAVTRPRERSEETVRLLESKGWEAIVVPAIEVVPMSKREILAVIRKLENYDWLILTSASGAEIMHRYFGSKLKKVKIAVIGPKTKEFLEKKGIKIHFIPSEYKAEALAEELGKQGIKGKKLLVARAAIGREILVEELKKHAEVVEVPLYDTIMPKDKSPIKAFAKSLEDGEIDAAIFTSSQTVKNIFAVAGREKFAKNLSRAIICAIGPITAKTLSEFGVRVDIMPEKYTVEACAEAIEKFMGARELQKR